MKLRKMYVICLSFRLMADTSIQQSKQITIKDKLLLI